MTVVPRAAHAIIDAVDAGRLSRRALIGMPLALVASGCGIHLEEDAPHVPLVPQRTPIAAEAGLLALLRLLRHQRLALTLSSDSHDGDLARRHDRQVTVLDNALRRKGVPASELDRDDTATATSTVTPPIVASQGAFAAGERQCADAAAVLLATAPADLLPMLASLRAACLVGLARIDPAAPLPASPEPAPVPKAATVLPFLAATREAVYGLEVTAARARGKERSMRMDQLAQVRGLRLDQEVTAGASAPPAPTAYSLPDIPANATARAALTKRLLGALVDAYGAALTPVLAVAELRAPAADWLARAAVLADASGVAATPFPGLR